MSSILVVAGEASGDQHAAGLISELKKFPSLKNFQFFGSGGDSMKGEGVELLLHISRLSAIGPWEALGNAWGYWSLYRGLKKEIRHRRPRLAILVDFPDFNLRLAATLKEAGVPICYFIGPQIWAWRASRLKQIRRYVDLMLVIFPFEEDYYRRQGVKAIYVGNPTAHRIHNMDSPSCIAKDDVRVMALLPGSRESEVRRLLPVQLDSAAYVVRRYPVSVRIVCAPGIDRGWLVKLVEGWKKETGNGFDVRISEKASEVELAGADIALIKSGTSTLEATLVGVPFAMIYRLSPVSWLVLRPWVRIQRFCLTNWIAGEEVVPEFVQWNARAEKVGEYFLHLLRDQKAWEAVRDRLLKVARRLGSENAYLQAAQQIKCRILEEEVILE